MEGWDGIALLLGAGSSVRLGIRGYDYYIDSTSSEPYTVRKPGLDGVKAEAMRNLLTTLACPEVARAAGCQRASCLVFIGC